MFMLNKLTKRCLEIHFDDIMSYPMFRLWLMAEPLTERDFSLSSLCLAPRAFVCISLYSI